MISSDIIQPFLIDHSSIRGRLVRLDKVINDILQLHNYHYAVCFHLAEQIMIATLLAATLEKDGILTVQSKGNGAIRFMVVDVMANGSVRGYADVNEEKLAKLVGKSRSRHFSLKELMGEGYLAITHDEAGLKERHQSVVALEGNSISDAFRGYFLQSNQVEIALNIAIHKPDIAHNRWGAGGLIVERMPLEGGNESKISTAEQEEIWERTKLFMMTLKEKEVLDPAITPQNLLYRLFNEDGVWVYKLQHLVAACRCSRKRIRDVFKTLNQQELLDSLDEKGKMKVNCQFCNTKQIFTKADINRLFALKPKK